jgi:hypothetical protein
MSPRAIRCVKWAWNLAVAAGFIATFFGVPLPKDFGATLSALAPIEAWWWHNAAHPILAAFAAGLLVSTVLIPWIWRHVRPHLFPDKLAADIGALPAFELILSRSKWAKRHRKNWRDMPPDRYEKGRSESELIEGRLNQLFRGELRNWLRNETLACWGSESTSATTIHITPEKPIEPQRWDEMEISFESGHANAAYYVAGRRNGELAFVNLRFCERQIRRQFPLVWRRK